MITEEERAKLKVGDIVHIVVEDLNCVMSGEIKDDSNADFTFFTRSLDDESIFVKKIDAYRAVKKLMLDEFNYIKDEISLIDISIEQLEQENG